MQALRRLSLSVALPATLVLILAATSQAAPHLKPPPALVRVAHDATLGQILVKANGRTLYHFSRDRNGKIGCTGTCTTTSPGAGAASGWPWSWPGHRRPTPLPGPGWLRPARWWPVAWSR